MKKLLCGLFITVLINILNLPVVIAADKDNIKIDEALSIKLNNYNNKLSDLKMQYIKNQDAIILMFYDPYDLYEEAVINDKIKNNNHLVFKHSNSIGYDLKRHLTWYDSNAQQRYYANISKVDLGEFKKIKINSSLLESKLRTEKQKIEEDLKLLKNSEQKYTKQDFKATKMTYKRVQKYYKQANGLNETLSEVCQANKISVPNDTETGDFIAYSSEYSIYPDIEKIEDYILKNPGRITFKTDTAAYYNQIYSLRKQAIPVLASLLLTSDENKKLQMKKEQILSQKNLSDTEKDARLKAILEEEEASITKAFEQKDMEEKISNLSKEQKEQLNQVYKILGQVTSLQLSRFIEDVADIYGAYKNSDGDVLKGLLAYSQAHPTPTPQEQIYINIIQDRATKSSRIIYEQLDKYQNITNLEKSFDNNINTNVKNKKAKKLKDEELDIE